MTAPPAYRFDPSTMSVDEQFGFLREFGPHVAGRLGFQPGMRVLEVGCGSGGFTRFLAGLLSGKGEIVGVDHDPELLERARKEVPSAPDLPVRFETGDAFALPFEAGAFDAVVSQFVLCVLPEPLRALREMRRVTRPGGLVASVSCFCKSGIFPTFPGLHRFEGFDRLTALRARFAEAYRVHVRNPGLGIPSGRDLDIWADYWRAGFSDLRITGYMSTYAPGDARWSDEEARAYVEARKRIDLGLLERLDDGKRETLERNGFGSAEVEELRRLLERKYAWLLADVRRIREGMEVLADPAVLITGRVPEPLIP